MSLMPPSQYKLVPLLQKAFLIYAPSQVIRDTLPTMILNYFLYRLVLSLLELYITGHPVCILSCLFFFPIH